MNVCICECVRMVVCELLHTERALKFCHKLYPASKLISVNYSIYGYLMKIETDKEELAKIFELYKENVINLGISRINCNTLPFFI